MGYLVPLNPVAQNLLVVGFVVASVGLITLAMATLVVRVLPWWVAGMLLAGSPPAAVFLGPLFGVPWALVGYAVLRAGSGRGRFGSEPPPDHHLTRQPPARGDIYVVDGQAHPAVLPSLEWPFRVPLRRHDRNVTPAACLGESASAFQNRVGCREARGPDGSCPRGSL